MHHLPSRFVACALAAALTGCASDDDADFEAPGQDAVYLVNTTIFGAEGESSTYFAPLESLSADVDFDRSKALEAPGMAKLYAREGLGWFALGAGEEPRVTRYTLSESGQFTEGESISFQPRGTNFLADTMVFVSNTQAYYFDAPNDQLIRWNPDDMSIDGTIDLSDARKPDLTTIYDIKPLLREDGSLLFAVAWRNFETDASFAGTGLFVIDTNTDSVSYRETERCQGVTWSATTPNGDMYLGTTPYYAVRQRVKDAGPAACVLRVRARETDFDSDYQVELASLVDGRVAGGLARGGDDKLFFRALEPDVALDADSDITEVWSGQHWRWYSWELQGDRVEAVESLPPSAAGGLTYDIGDHVYATDSKDDFSATTLIDLSASGGPEPALDAPGYIYGVARIR